MGYRSEVKIATTREGYDALLKIMDLKNKSKDVEYPLIGSDIDPGYFEEEGGSVVFGWDDIKWYVGLLCDVTNVEEALGELDEQEIPYEFCRIGESWDDIEFRTSGDNENLAIHVEPSVAIEVVSS